MTVGELIEFVESNNIPYDAEIFLHTDQNTCAIDCDISYSKLSVYEDMVWTQQTQKIYMPECMDAPLHVTGVALNGW